VFIERPAVHYAAEILLHDALGVWVTVGKRIAQGCSIAAYAHKIHPPAVDAYALKHYTTLRNDTQRPDDFAVESIDVPVYMVAYHGHGVVKSGQFLILHASAAETSQQCASACRTEVYSQKVIQMVHCLG